MRILANSSLLLLTTVFVWVGCGEFQSPHFFTGSDASAPLDDTTTVFADVDPPGVVLPCTIVPHTTTLSHDDEGRLRLQGAYSLTPYARFAVQNPPEDTVFVWRLNGTLPAGLSFDEKTGVLDGVAAEMGQRTVQVTAASIPVDDLCYRCDPVELTIEIGPPCESDAECTLDDLPDVPLLCNTDQVFTETEGGVCAYEPPKSEDCPARVDRFQLLFDAGGLMDNRVDLAFSGVVLRHESCRPGGFSLDDGGHEGHCLSVLPDDDGPAAGLESIDIAYRLPWDYRAPIAVGEHYAFHYERSPGWYDSHYTDGTLFVFSIDRDEALPANDISRLDRTLLFAGHTGRVLPDDLLNDCQQRGICPFVSRAGMAPALCGTVSDTMCGERTPIALFLEDVDGLVHSVLPEETPALLARGKGDSDRAAAAASTPAPFALHMGMSDAFIGESAIDCIGSEDQYRLSYFVVPSNACAFLHVAPLEHTTTANAPTELGVRVETDFSPAGNELSFQGTIEEQPAQNTLFEPKDIFLAASRTLTFSAVVPGHYAFRVSPDDGEGTPSCGEQELVQFAVEPRKGARVYLELSQREAAAFRLLVAPEELDREAYLGGFGSWLVAGRDNPSPAWVFGENSTLGATHRDEAAVVSTIPGAAVQSFNAGWPAAGRYRVVVHRLQEFEDADAPEVDATLRVILDHNLDTTIEFTATMGDCFFWDVGTLEVTATALSFVPSGDAPDSLCGLTGPLDPGPFDLP